LSSYNADIKTLPCILSSDHEADKRIKLKLWISYSTHLYSNNNVDNKSLLYKRANVITNTKLLEHKTVVYKTKLNTNYPPATRGKLIVWGLLASYPFGGMTWQVLHYLAGLRRLGFDVWYVEDSDKEVLDPATLWSSSDYTGNVEYLARQMRAIGLDDRWVFRPPGVHDHCLGATDIVGLSRLYREADAVLNLCGSHWLRPEQADISCLIYLETDPVPNQVEIANGETYLIEHMKNYDFLFTYAENLMANDCLIPVEQFHWHLTRPPVCVDWWQALNIVDHEAAFTTIARWQHTGNDVVWKGQQWRWSKHYEFLRFINLPSRASLPLEISVSGISDDDKNLLQKHGWRLCPAETLSDPSSYHDYICTSLGEFTVAKEQYVRPRTGWFSDRSVCYLAAGRPVITQETGFSNIIATGEGLFAFSTEEEALAAIDTVATDYARHSKGAKAVAREYFNSECVLGDLLQVVGLL
jgi:hypothetical protein